MTAALDILHTAALRLREAADRFVVAFERAAEAAAAAARAEEPPEPPRLLPRNHGRVVGSVTQEVLELSKRPGGITAGDVVPITAKYGLQANASTAAARLGRLAATGKLVSTRSQYSKYGSLRYFATAELAESWAAEQGPPALEAADPVALPQLAAMFEADAPAVAKALAVIAPAPRPADPPPSAPRAAPYIPPTPSMARGERRQQLADAAFVAPVAKPTGEAIVPENVKRTVVNAPAFDARFQVDPKTVSADPESFSAQWARLRGEGPGA
jgi:hypothetical protein